MTRHLTPLSSLHPLLCSVIISCNKINITNVCSQPPCLAALHFHTSREISFSPSVALGNTIVFSRRRRLRRGKSFGKNQIGERKEGRRKRRKKERKRGFRTRSPPRPTSPVCPSSSALPSFHQTKKKKCANFYFCTSRPRPQ